MFIVIFVSPPLHWCSTRGCYRGSGYGSWYGSRRRHLVGAENGALLGGRREEAGGLCALGLRAIGLSGWWCEQRAGCWWRDAFNEFLTSGVDVSVDVCFQDRLFTDGTAHHVRGLASTMQVQICKIFLLPGIHIYTFQENASMTAPDAFGSAKARYRLALSFTCSVIGRLASLGGTKTV